MKKEKGQGEKSAGYPLGRELKIKNYELRIWATDPHRRNEKGKMKKEKGEGEKAAGCLPGGELKITNYELRIWAADLHRLALISLNLSPLTLSPGH